MNGTKTRLMFGMLGMAAVGLISTTQGCSSSSTTTGTGGHVGTDGGTGTGGTTTNTDASGDTAGGLCVGTALAGAPVVTDFSDVVQSTSTPANLSIPNKGGVSGYGGVAVSVVNGALSATGTITAGTYAGVSVFFNDCIDASAYSGVSFTLTGDFGTCDMLKLGVNFPQIEPLPPASGHGVCTFPAGGTNNCYGPGSPYTVATTSVTFASMNGGGAVATVTPDAQDRLTGIGFGFHGPTAVDGSAGGCTVNFTIDNIAFIP
jgi:hypothetical protein